jgi:hypothetical protein
MYGMSTTTCESHSPRGEDDDSPPAGCKQFGLRIGGLATYYELRCTALEATISALEAELDRKEHHVQQVRDRYEELLQKRTCDEKPLFTR